MKVRYNKGMGYPVEISDGKTATCISLDTAKKLQASLLAVIEQAETPEEEMSEFEKAVKDRLWRTLEYSETFRKDENKWVRGLAAELLTLAEREIVNRVAKECYKDDFCIEDTVKFNEEYKLGKEVALKEFEEKYKQSWFNEGKIAGRFEGLTENEKYQQGVHDGKEEALKDLPRWRKWGNGACGGGKYPLALVESSPGHYFLADCLGITGEKYIMLSDLEKLPKED